MRLTERQLLDALARMPSVDTLELAVILDEAHATVHRAPSGLLAYAACVRLRAHGRLGEDERSGMDSVVPSSTGGIFVGAGGRR